MKPRLVAMLLLACLLLLVGLIPGVAAQTPPPPGEDRVKDLRSGEAVPLPASQSPTGRPVRPASASPQAEAAINEKTVTGTLYLIWGDSAPGEPAQAPLKYTLTVDGGRVYELSFGEKSTVSPGDLLLLNGRRVVATTPATLAPAQAGRVTELPVTKLVAVPGPQAPQSITGSAPWVSVACKFSDVAAESRTLAYFDGMYSGTRPGLDHYWREASYNNVNVVGSDAFGWYTLPHPRSYYVDDDSGNTDLGALATDCTAVADADVYFPDYVGINLIFNDSLGCCAWGGSAWYNLDGVEDGWRTTWEPPWAYENINIFYHEMGHGFGMPHSSGMYGYTYDNVWDVLSSAWYNCDFNADPVYGCVGQNTIAFHHDLLGWIPPGQNYLADLGNHRLTLEQLDLPATNDYLMAKIPIEESSNHFYTVEARRLEGYDEKLPGNAVIIHEVDLNNWGQARVVDVDWNEDTSDDGAMWTVGEEFIGAGGDISVSIDAATATGFDISIVNNSEMPFDPYEPNDTRETATPIAYGDELTGAIIQVSGDEDWYTFEVNAEDEIELYIDAASIGSSLDPYIYLYRWTGSELDLVRDGYYGGDFADSIWLPDGGTYYLLIQDYNHGYNGGSEFFYDLALYLLSPWDYTLFPAGEDAYVNQGARTANYGSAAFLRVKNAAADMNAYMKFQVDLYKPSAGYCLGDSQTWMRLFVKEPSTDGGHVYAVNNSWNEGTINWNNAPPVTGSAIGSYENLADEHYWYAWLDYELGDGLHSFALHNDSTNSADYSSTEGSGWPVLEFDYQVESTHKPRPRIFVSDYSGLVPFTTTFFQETGGCPTSYYWEFGDGATSTQENPTHTFTDPGWYYVQLTTSNSVGSSTRGRWVSAHEPPTIAYISPATNATIGGIPSQAADILRYDKATNGWAMYFDGSDHSLTKNIGSFAFDDEGNLLLVFSVNQPIPGLGTATPRDVVKFTPDDPWTYPIGSGAWSWYLRGSWSGVGLTTTAESIDGFDNRWGWDDIMSTTGAAALPTTPVLKAADEDIITWFNFGPYWYLELDGSPIPGMAAEDINGIWYDTQTNEYYITILGAFNLGGVTGDGKSIVRLEWNNGWQPSLHPWLASGAVFPTTIDAIELGR